MVKLFNFWYFFFVFLAAATVIVPYVLLRNKSQKTKKIVIFIMLILNLALHFLKLTFPPYSTNPPEKAISDIWFTNVCATSVLFFPFIFISKSDTAKDYMVYLGIISGFLAVFYPTEALNKSVFTLDLWRFYFCHIVIFAAPLLTVLLGVHKLDIRRIWKVPFCIMAMLLFIVCNQVLQSELGIIDLRGEDFFNVGFHNPSLIWGPTDDVAVVFSWLTPDFMKVVPFGPYAGQEKYWPFFWMLPGVIVYFLLIPVTLCFILDFKNTVNSFKDIFSKIKSIFVKAK